MGKLLSVFDNTVLVWILAGVGVLSLCCGVNAVWHPRQARTWRTSMTMPELEAASKLPKGDLLEVRGGYVFWPGAKESIEYQTRFGAKVKGSERVYALYVPLLSQAAYARWRAHLDEGHGVGSLPYHECRVILHFETFDLDNDGRPRNREIETQRTFRGEVRRLADADKAAVAGTPEAKLGYDPRWTLVMSPAGPDNPEIDHIISYCICVIAVLSCVPLGIWAIRRWRKPRAEKPALPSPEAESETPND